jgi:hypothetical protein
VQTAVPRLVGTEKAIAAMKRLLSSLLASLALATAAQAIQVGDPQKELAATLGNPVAVRKKPDGEQVWKFKDGTTVWVADGVVRNVAKPTIGNFIHRDGKLVSPELSNRKELLSARSDAPIATGTKASAPNAPIGAAPGDEGRTVPLHQVGYFLLAGGLIVLAIVKFGTWFAIVRTVGWWMVSWFCVPLASYFSAMLTPQTRSSRLWR